jgi:hypothetical protein
MHLFIPAVLLVASPLWAQLIEPEVQLHFERLPDEEKQYLAGVGDNLSTLILAREWTDGSYQYKLPLRIDIFPEKFSLSGIYHRYSAGVMTATRSGIQLRDTRWDFRYSSDMQLKFGEPYDPFTGLIEFYIWMCLGFEGDLLSELGGQAYYEKAKFVADAAQFENQYSLGWDYRRDMARDLTVDKKYLNMRTAVFHVRAGIYYAERDEADSARPHLRRAVELMLQSDPNLIQIQREDTILRLIDREKLAAALALCGEDTLLQRLAEWDKENAIVYE